MKKIQKTETSAPVHPLAAHIDSIVELFPSSVEIVGTGLTRSIVVKGKTLDIADSRKVIDKGVDFNWGYEGSGPSQLALSLLLKYVPADIAVQYYKIVEIMLVSKIEFNNFTMDLKFKKLMTDILHNQLKKKSPEGKSPYYDIEEIELNDMTEIKGN